MLVVSPGTRLRLVWLKVKLLLVLIVTVRVPQPPDETQTLSNAVPVVLPYRFMMLPLRLAWTEPVLEFDEI